MGLKFDLGIIKEERQFTNPQVRFRRIRGRIVPIFNKKRIGQDITAIGESTFKFGATIAGVSLVKRTKIFKALFPKKTKQPPKFKIKSLFFEVTKSDSLKKKVFKRSASLASKSVKFGLKNSGKLGLIITAIGALGIATGSELQAQSPFGKDFFFIKTRRGRGS